MTPLLATTLSLITDLRYPVYASPKLDGIRCLLMESMRTGKRIAYSRKFKPIANLHIRQTLELSDLPLGLDGELIVGDNFQNTASGVMTVGEKPPFIYHVFDYFDGAVVRQSYTTRHSLLTKICEDRKAQYNWLHLVPQSELNSLDELVQYEQATLDAGYEGVMLRSPTGRYKFGRSTATQQYLIKLKRFDDDDARVVGFTELQHNDNDLTTDIQGHAERSSALAGLVGGNTLGALIVRNERTKQQFKIGTGFTAVQRKQIWNERESWIGRIVTYKFQNHGIKNAPRCPVFLRERLDAKL